LLGDEVGMFSASLVIFVLTFLNIFIYQSVFTWLLGGTLGKFFLKLKVVNLWSLQTLTFSESCVRAFFWIIGALCFFIPHISVFFNPKRRAMQGRISDSIVVTETGFEYLTNYPRELLVTDG